MIFLRRKFKIQLLFFAVLGIYYPSIFSGFNLVDDVETFGRLEDTQHFDFIGLFRSANLTYYRPFTTLTFFFDKAVWELNPSFMHLENIVLHALNTLLVFLIAEKVFLAMNIRKYELPLLSALLFALHPVNAETVNWISGRYDLLATLFVLTTTLLILKGLQGQRIYFILSALTLFLGCFTKESVVFFFPAATFLVLFPSKQLQTTTPLEISPVAQNFKNILPFAVSYASYFLLRTSFSKSVSSGMGEAAGQVAQGVMFNIADTVRITLKVFGFYVKKLLMPLPLNFAIIAVHDLYFWVGLVSLLVGFYFLIRRSLFADYLLVSLSLVSSGIVIAFARTAWTPVAERYLYLSSAFFAISIVGLVFLLLKRYQREAWIVTGALSIILAAAIVTAQRNIIWQDNVSLYEDTVRKSPEFKKLNNELAKALKDKGRIAEANTLLSVSRVENPNHVFLYINQADLQLEQGNVLKAREIIEKIVQNKKASNREALKMLARINEERLFKTTNRSQRMRIALDLIETYGYLYPKTKDPLCLYRNGQLLLMLGQKQRAGELFQQAYEAAPEGAYYKDPAKKLAGILKLGKKEAGRNP